MLGDMKRFLLALGAVLALLPSVAHADGAYDATYWQLHYARWMICQFDSGGVCSMSYVPVSFQDIAAKGDNGFTAPAGLMNWEVTKRQIVVDQQFLNYPGEDLAAVVIHEARHNYDYVAHEGLELLFRSASDFCYTTETNALTEMTRFWEWHWNEGIYPERNAFETQMRQQVALDRRDGLVNSRTWPAYQQECGSA